MLLLFFIITGEREGEKVTLSKTVFVFLKTRHSYLVLFISYLFIYAINPVGDRTTDKMGQHSAFLVRSFFLFLLSI